MIYIMNLILLFLFIMQLGLLRCGVYAKLRLSKHSKTFIRKNSKGFLNYWTYKRINKICSLGVIYYINIAYLISFVTFSAVAVCLGFFDFAEIPIMLIAVVTAIIGMVSTVYSSIYCSRANYGKSFVFVAKNKETGRLYSSLFDWFFTLIPFFVIYLSFYY